MPKLTIGQKGTRVVDFIFGLRNARVAAALAASGFKQKDLDEGWALLKALTDGRLNAVATPPDADPALIDALDAWENRWFPIVNATLRTRFPAVHAKLFLNLRQTEGVEVIISVGTLLERVAKLKTTGDEGEARALLAERGFNAKIIADAKSLLTSIGRIDDTPEPVTPVPADVDAAREKALWDWYREWSDIAQTVIEDRRSLRSLGYLTPNGRLRSDAEVEEEDAEEDAENDARGGDTDAGNGAPKSTDAGTAGKAAKPKSDKPRIPPGFPGGSPFIDEEDEEDDGDGGGRGA